MAQSLQLLIKRLFPPTPNINSDELAERMWRAMLSLLGACEFAYSQTYRFLKEAWIVGVLISLPVMIEEIYLYDLGLTRHLVWHHALLWNIANYLMSSVGFYIFTRFLFSDGDLREAVAVNWDSARTFFPFLVLYTAGGTAVGFMTNLDWIWIPVLVGFAAQSLFALWAVSTPGGGNVISPITSVRKSVHALPWAFALLLLTAMPILILAVIAGAVASLMDHFAWWLWFSAAALAVAAWFAHVLTFATVHAIARHLGVSVTPRRDIDAFS